MVVLGLSGCSPALDWREVRPADSGVLAFFPCRPEHHVRTLPLAGQPVEMRLSSCKADGMTFAISHAALRDPTDAPSALGELRVAAASNVGMAEAPALADFVVPGASLTPGSGRIRAVGRLPGGEAATVVALFFARGPRVFQATVFGEPVASEAVETFFGELKVMP